MKKFFMILAMVLMAVFCLRAGTLGDVFENKVRPTAAMLQEMPAEELAKEGFGYGAMAVVTPESMAAAAEALSGLTPAAEETEGGKSVKAYVYENADKSEVLVLVSGDGQNVILYMTGTAEAVKKALK